MSEVLLKTASATAPVRDHDARRVIREELAINLLVEAGAGSGKTQMLAERMAAGVAAGVYDIEHMAAVTFTRKAASELRGRFHLALEKQLAACMAAGPDLVLGRCGAGASTPADLAGIKRLQHALGNLERFFAGTIHSFCARLLRERPVESGVSPGFTELDEVQDEDVRNRAWRDVIGSARAAGDPQVVALLETGVRPNDLDSVFATICLNEDVEFPPGDAECPEPGPAWKALEKFWRKLEAKLPAEIDPGTTCRIQKAALEFRRKLRVARKRLDRPATIADLLDTWDCESRITLYQWSKDKAEQQRAKVLINGMHEEFCAETVIPFLSTWRQYIYRLSVSLLSRARDHARAERRRRNSLNYGDLLNLTVKVLRENTNVRRALQRKYRFLFVDEFQDTDPVQAEIVFLLAADEEHHSSVGQGLQAPASSAVASTSTPSVQFIRSQRSNTEPRTPNRDPRTATNVQRTANWRTVRLRPGALFVVGDPKQSIYRFRRADIEIYNTVRERFSQPAMGRVVTLTTNFRSTPALCEWANGVFDGPFPSSPTQHSPRFARLDPNPERKASRAGGICTLTYTCDGKEVPGEDSARIARYIRSEVDSGRRKYSDFLILTRKKKDRIAPYAAALEAMNVPLEVSGAGAFGDSAEVQALTVLIRALADPQDQLSLVAVLRGPLFGISDRELFEFKQSGGWFSIFAGAKGDTEPEPRTANPDPRNANCEPRTPVDTALAALNQYYRWTRLLPAGAALDKILEHSGYLALAATTPGGVEAGDLLHAVDRVRQIVEEGGSLSDAADALEADGDFSNEVESLPLEPGRADVVRIMNLHKAKGLEADVVFLADPCGGVSPRVDVHIRRDGGRAVGWFKLGRRYTRQDGSPGFTLLGEHADWPLHEQAEQPFLDQEQTRLYYVAATRAREMLVISRHGQKDAPAWGILTGALDDAKELRVPAKVPVSPSVPPTCSSNARAEAGAARLAADARVKQASWSITSVTAEAKHLGRMSALAATASEDDATRVVAQNTASHRADAGMAWGTLIHGLLEHAMRHTAATREDLRRLAMWLTVEEPQLRGVIDMAIDTVQAVAAADFWRQAKVSEHSEEAPFTFAEAERLTTGVIDLIHRGPQGWCITDYKTDADGGSRKSTTYEAQAAQYRTALEACGVKVDGIALRSVRSE